MPGRDELITAALHDRANTVTAESLRHPVLSAERLEQRPASRHRPRTAFLAAASVVAVLTVAVGAHALRPGARREAPAGGGRPASLAGTSWQLTGVRNAARTFVVPAGYRARLDFAAGGRLSGLDGANALAGRYRVTADRISITVGAAGTAGGTSTFPAQQAMASLYTPATPGSSEVTSTYRRTPRTLTLGTGAWTLTFGTEDAAPTTTSPPASTAPPSPTGTPVARGRSVLGLVRSATRTAAGFRVVLAPATRQADGRFVALPGRAAVTCTIPAGLVPDGGITLVGAIEVTVARGRVSSLTIVGG